MRTEVIEADTIEAAAQQILNELKRDANGASRRTSRRDNVIYFDGWDGLGASAVLRTVAERLDPVTRDSKVLASGLHFDQIIHIDCSKWENRRVLQREIAKHLQLPTEVMEMFDWQDEDDDIHGVAQGSRLEIPQVLRAMFRRIKELNHRFLVIFHNGSSEEIDLSSFGFPLSGYFDNMVLWTFQGRFRLYPRIKVGSALHNSAGMAKTDIFVSASYLDLEGRDPQELWSVLVHREAAEVAENNIRIHTAQVAECFFLHMLKLCCMGYNFKMDYDLATHTCNYWMCEGILQQLQQGALGDTSIVHTDDDEESWRTADALQREIQLDVDYYNYNHHYFPSHLVRYGKTMPCWTSPYGFMLVPVGAIPNADMLLQDFNNLTVLKLSRRAFSFSSPPFLYYHNLKFLWLDHCEDQEVSSTAGFPIEEKKKKISTDNRASKEADIQRRHCFFQKLWVLDVRYTSSDWILSAQMMDFKAQLRELNVMGAQDWDMGQLHGRLPNIRKLRVTKSSICCSSCLGSYMFSEMDKMELLDLSGNSISPLATRFSAGPAGSNNNITASSVVTVIIDDGFVGLKEISLRGCANLKNLFLRGVLQDLYSLDISGTAVQTLDLSATTAPNLDELYLLGCDKLCAILWPTQDKRKEYLNKLHIDTNTRLGLTTPPGDENNKEGSTSPLSLFSVLHGGKAPYEFEWYISVRDVRFLLSLAPMRSYFDSYRAHVEISSPTQRTIDAGGSIVSRHNEGYYNSIPVLHEHTSTTFKYHLLQAREGCGDDAPTIITEAWPCPDAPSDGRLKCYINIQDTKIWTKSPLGVEETMTSIAMPDFICDGVLSLHVHDALSMAIPGPVGGRWNALLWCRVERCPNLDSVFTTPAPLQVAQDGQQADGNDQIFWYLRSFWGSQLPKVRFIWNWGKTSFLVLTDNHWYSKLPFVYLEFLHLDSCPRLIHVLPLPMAVMDRCLQRIVTLEIVWCSDLKEIFPFYYSGAESSDKQRGLYVMEADKRYESTHVVELGSLKHIHLNELPRLRSICGGNARLGAPHLETIKIRGCWSLRRLPAVSYTHDWGKRRVECDAHNRIKKVECDCEKEWWDRLEWDGLEAWFPHHPSLYQPTHPRYYKKRMLRGSVLI